MRHLCLFIFLIKTAFCNSQYRFFLLSFIRKIFPLLLQTFSVFIIVLAQFCMNTSDQIQNHRGRSCLTFKFVVLTRLGGTLSIDIDDSHHNWVCSSGNFYPIFSLFNLIDIFNFNNIQFIFYRFNFLSHQQVW